ncbi:metallophosphoesterase [Mucilaginibacter flavidus]|uniref:metallophosphoesterase n=1 Tax=Mucilaginibacter flavidus TaxID=2949309 RepID=UPI00209317E8|nr:metallophosphoesterase [Mucilaginibacter flavidus]MCO5947045.1 metallophosphoesterase [Mucilaginibacter flavidus]
MERTFVIGDIHGCYDELIELTKKIGLNDEDMLVSVGDIVDRGNKSKDVYEYFIGRPNSKVIVGNHERKHMNGVLSYAQEIVKVQFGKDYESFLSWLSTLDYSYELSEAIIVHAAFEHDKSLKDQKDEVLSGSTSGERYLEKKFEPETYWNDYYKGEKPIIYGHHVVGEFPMIKNNTYGIDTGSCHGGFLTAIELPGFIIHQVKSKEDYWKSEQKVWQTTVLKSKDWHNMDFTNIKKQLEKLSFVEDIDARTFLNRIENWTIKLENLLTPIKDKLDSFTKDLINKHKEEFSVEASKFDFKTFIFKSKSNNLKVDDIKKSLNTPQKIFNIAKELNIEDLPTL